MMVSPEAGTIGNGRLPGISVIIPTHNGRRFSLADLLRSLATARHRAGVSSEVIVINDKGAADHAEISAVCSEYGALALTGPPVVATKRNLGAAASRFDHLLFVDSDCIAHQDLLRAHWEAITAAPSDVAGVVGLSRFVGPGSWWWRLAGNSGRYNSCFDWPLTFSEALWGGTANLSIRADVFEYVGGFDDRTWTIVGGEDVNLCASVVDCGHRLVTAPTAIVLHRRDQMARLHHLLRSMVRYGAADAYLCARLPLRRRWYLSPVVAIGMGCAVAALTRRPAAVGRTGLMVATLVLARDFFAQRERSARLVARRRAWGIGQGYDLDPHEEASRDPFAGGVAESEPEPGYLLDLATCVFDWSFDFGAAAGALRHGRLDLLLRRFTYVDSTSFVPRTHPADRSSAPFAQSGGLPEAIS